MVGVNISGLPLRSGVEADVLYDDDSIQVNLMQQGGGMITRIQVAVEGDQVVLKVWEPENWATPEPQQTLVLGKVAQDAEQDDAE